jgi:hypothetical protein
MIRRQHQHHAVLAVNNTNMLRCRGNGRGRIAPNWLQQIRNASAMLIDARDLLVRAQKNSRLVAINTSVTSGRWAPRKKAFCSRLSPSGRRMNGLGEASRETGQRREPAPPHSKTGDQCRLHGLGYSIRYRGTTGLTCGAPTKLVEREAIVGVERICERPKFPNFIRQ